jgi:hypothetical protein
MDNSALVSTPKPKKTRERKQTGSYIGGLATKLSPVQDEYLKSVLKDHFGTADVTGLSVFEKEIFAGIAAIL